MPMGGMSPLEFERAVSVAKREARADMAKVRSHVVPFCMHSSVFSGVGAGVGSSLTIVPTR